MTTVGGRRGPNVAGVYDFAKRPLWIVSHILVVVAVLLMLRLGFWQLDRWQEESDNLARIEAAIEAPPVPLDDVVDLSDAPGDVPESARWQRVVVSGTWDTSAEVAIRGRALDGNSGGWLLTPLVQADGSEVAVVRGWIPLEMVIAGPPYSGAESADGEVEVTGLVGLTQQRGSLGPVDPAEGTLDTLARVDIERLDQQVDGELEPVWVQQQSVVPDSSDGFPAPISVELPSPSQNLSYTGQWFLFAAIFGVGYLLILRKVARGRSGGGGESDVPVQDAPALPGEPPVTTASSRDGAAGDA